MSPPSRTDFPNRSKDAETDLQLRSRVVQTLNGDPAASPLGGAHRLGAPYSSHRAPQRVRLGSSLAAALLGARRVPARQGWEGEKVACLSILLGSAFHVLGMKTIEFCNAEIVFPYLLAGVINQFSVGIVRRGRGRPSPSCIKRNPAASV